MSGKIRAVLILLVAVLCLGGCGKSGSESSEKEYEIYYTNLAGTRLTTKPYIPVSDRFDGILKELLEQFQHPDYTDVSSALPMGVNINSYTTVIDELQVDFDGAYLGLSNVQEVLLRAGLVKTLVQLPGIMRVRITVDGQALTDNDGKEVSAMSDASFIDTQGEGINSYHYMTLNLYFSNAAGDKVVKEMRNVFYSSNLITEKVIAEQIIRGPVNEKLLPVADPSVIIRSIKISRNICVIDLDSKFNEDPGNGVDPETCLYAFVNAICDACDVEGVQFKIEGETNVRFRGQVTLDQIFQRNADIIETSENISEPLTEIFLDSNGAETENRSAGVQAETAGAAVASGNASLTTGVVWQILNEEETLSDLVSQAETTTEPFAESDGSEELLSESGDTDEGNEAAETEMEDTTVHALTNNAGVGVDPVLVGGHS